MSAKCRSPTLDIFALILPQRVAIVRKKYVVRGSGHVIAFLSIALTCSSASRFATARAAAMQDFSTLARIVGSTSVGSSARVVPFRYETGRSSVAPVARAHARILPTTFQLSTRHDCRACIRAVAPFRFRSGAPCSTHIINRPPQFIANALNCRGELQQICCQSSPTSRIALERRTFWSALRSRFMGSWRT